MFVRRSLPLLLALLAGPACSLASPPVPTVAGSRVVGTVMAYAAVREDIIYYLLAELNQPSARAASGEPDWQEEGFTLDARAEAEAEAEDEDEE